MVPGASVRAAKIATRKGVSNVSVDVHHLLTSHAVTTASRVLPSAMALEVAIDPKVVAFAMSAPAPKAGQARLPQSRHAASASPLGGQTGLALGWSDAMASPSFASTKYANPRAIGPRILAASGESFESVSVM